MSKLKKVKPNNKLYGIILIAVFAVLGTALLIYSNAATPSVYSPEVSVTQLASGNASLSLSPASGSYSNGSQFTVSVTQNSGTVPTAGIDAFLTYDATKLDYISANTNGGVFTDCYGSTPSGGSGSVKFSCVKNGSTFTGNQKIGEVTFRTKVGTGTTAVTFAANSEIYDQSVSNIWDGVTTGGTYTLGTTTTPPTGGGGGGGGGTTTPPTSGGGGTTTPTTGTSGGSKTTPKTTTTAPPTSGGGGTSTPTTTSPSTTPGVPSDPSASPSETTASTTTAPQKINTNSIIIYAAVIGGAIAVLSASGVAFTKFQRKSKFNRAHGISNSAVVFDANSSVHNPQTNSIDQGPIVTPTAPVSPAPTVTTKGPEGNIITPNGNNPSS